MTRIAAPRATFLVTLIGLVALVAGCRLPYTGGAKAVSPSSLGSEWLRAAPTPVVRQQQRTDCGLAALAMVAGAWGRTWSPAELAHEAKPTSKGVKLGALRDVARARGLEAYAVRGKTTDLEHELAQGRPVLLGLILPFDQGHNLSHYEVAVAYNPRDGAVVTLDPASGKFLRRSRKVLDLEWKPAGYATLVVVGERQPKENSHAQPSSLP